MKSLYQTIDEARSLYKFPLSYDEFEEFVLRYFEECDDGADEILKDIPEKLHEALKGYIDGHYNGSEESIQSMFDELQKIPLNRIPRILGAGSEGGIVDIGNNRVIKWFHKYNQVRHQDLAIKFYKYFMENPHKNFPVVYRVTDKYVVMEKLNTGTPLCRAYALDYADMDSIANGGTPQHIPDIVIKWHRECCKQIEKAVGHPWYPADLNVNNIGQRIGTKEIVWFDP